MFAENKFKADIDNLVVTNILDLTEKRCNLAKTLAKHGVESGLYSFELSLLACLCGLHLWFAVDSLAGVPTVQVGGRRLVGAPTDAESVLALLQVHGALRRKRLTCWR